MTKKSEGWISRRGQAGAATAVELVLERQPQEPVQQIADELIEDSPYQARGPISDASVSELVQGMSSAGFQGVLIVRPHSDVIKGRQGAFQLVYGHRRRAAWRLVCQERGEPCVLPVVVREVSDAQMLTIGAQENLQRQDLDPLEEAQIVAWTERMFFGKNQAEIGAILGKSSDWVRLRSRVAKLPDTLKDRLRARPRAMNQILELATLYRQDVETALALADRVVQEQLTLERVRQLLRDHPQTARHPPGPQPTQAGTASAPRPPIRQAEQISAAADSGRTRPNICEDEHNRGVNAAIVPPYTNWDDPRSQPQASPGALVAQQVQQFQHTITDARQQITALQASIHAGKSELSTARERDVIIGLLTQANTDLETLRSAAEELTATLTYGHTS